MRTLTLGQLKELKPCTEGFKWYSENIKTDNIEEILTILSKHRWDWCRWLFVRLLNDKSNRLISIYCAELVLPIFEKKYPSDRRPREAIEAAKLFLDGKISAHELKVKGGAAAYAAAAYAADAYADAAADAAYAAADAAAYAAAAADAYADAAADAAAYAAAAYAAAAYAAADAYADAAADAAAYAYAAHSQEVVSKVVELLKEMEK